MKNYKVAAILAIALLVISVTMNVWNDKKPKKYEDAVGIALSDYLSHYRTGSIDRSLTQVISDKKIYFGEAGREMNLFARDFQDLSEIHRQLTLMYGPLFSYDNQINSLSTNSIFDMFVNFSLFFDYLYENHSDSIAVEDDGLYLSFNELNDEERQGIEIIAEITGELEQIRSESSQDQTISGKKALLDYLEEYMIRSAEYFHTQEVQEKVAAFESIRIILTPK